jgi:hypothetical protein
VSYCKIIECKTDLISAVEALQDEPYLCLLDSFPAHSRGRWAFLAAHPFLVLTVRDGYTFIGEQDIVVKNGRAYFHGG